MFELAMTAFCAHQLPSLGFNPPDHLANPHQTNVSHQPNSFDRRSGHSHSISCSRSNDVGPQPILNPERARPFALDKDRKPAGKGGPQVVDANGPSISPRRTISATVSPAKPHNGRSSETQTFRRNTMKSTALKVLLAAAVLIPLAVYAQPRPGNPTTAT